MMDMLASTIYAAERVPLPDTWTRTGIDWLVSRTRQSLACSPPEAEMAFLDDMAQFPIAVHTAAANAQHYELPPAFFERILGPARKYSCCLYPTETSSLAEAEVFALEETCRHAGLADGQDILELGCGWGSLSLHMATAFPNARITSVSNSYAQREFILKEAQRLRLHNLDVMTVDMNDFSTQACFDRIVSVEMFEHMSNWRDLLDRARNWLEPQGRLFLHVFTHKSHSYRFRHDDHADWIGRYFFTGGIMPSHTLPHCFPDLFTVESEWRWPGVHYQKTAMDWLANFDHESETIDKILFSVYGRDAKLWKRRWRLFFLATAGLFGHADGQEWSVGHYLMRPSV